jgi:hypothetical protein
VGPFLVAKRQRVVRGFCERDGGVDGMKRKWKKDKVNGVKRKWKKDDGRRGAWRRECLSNGNGLSVYFLFCCGQRPGASEGA